MLIAGPTASGKSALALALAEKLGGTVINADSMQVYRDLRIITARPPPRRRSARPASALRPCRCRGELFGRALAASDVEQALHDVAVERRVPILVGGTGLYFKTLTQGLAAVPPMPPQVREGYRARLAERRRRAALCRTRPASIRSRRNRLMPNDSLAHPARAGGHADDRPLVARLAQRGHAAARRCGQGRQGFSGLRARGSGRAHRSAVRRHAGAGRARRGAGAWRRASSIRCCRP